MTLLGTRGEVGYPARFNLCKKSRLVQFIPLLGTLIILIGIRAIVTGNKVDIVFHDLGSVSQIMGQGHHGSSSRMLGSCCTSANRNDDRCLFETEEDQVGWAAQRGLGQGNTYDCRVTCMVVRMGDPPMASKRWRSSFLRQRSSYRLQQS